MKKLIFVDNDNEKLAKEDVDNVKDVLEYFANLPLDYINTIEVISEFRKISKDEMYKLLFSKDNCVCTFSMYTTNHYGSLYQMLGMLKVAGKNDIRDVVHIDCSGYLVGALNRNIRDLKEDVLDVLNAIETNYIITFKEGKCYRVRVELKGTHESFFKFEDINLLELLK